MTLAQLEDFAHGRDDSEIVGIDVGERETQDIKPPSADHQLIVGALSARCRDASHGIRVHDDEAAAQGSP